MLCEGYIRAGCVHLAFDLRQPAGGSGEAAESAPVTAEEAAAGLLARGDPFWRSSRMQVRVDTWRCIVSLRWVR